MHAYANLIENERKLNKELPILMLYGSLKEENVYPLIEETYKYVCSITTGIYLLKLPGDNSAISNHSYISYHKKMSNCLKEKIFKILS